MDPAYEFQAPQFVDFNNIGENDENAVDEFFNVDMESGEEWTTAVSTLEDEEQMECREAVERSKKDATFQVSAPVRIPHQVPHSLLPKNHPPSSSSLDIPRRPGKPSNMVTSWGTGQLTKTSGKGHLNSSKPQVKKIPQGKVGRADLHAAVKSTIGMGRSSPRLLHRTPRRLGVGVSRLLGGTPKRLGTNSQEPRLAAGRPRTQIQRSLNTPTASRSRMIAKSPSIPIPFPKSPDVGTRSKNRMLGEDLPQNQPSKQPTTKYRSQAEQILSYQRSTPSRFRSRPHQPPKAGSVPQRQLHPVPAVQNTGTRPKSAKAIPPPKKTTHARSIPKKATVVESLAESAKTKFGLHQRRLPSTELLRDSTTRPSITIPAPFKFTTQVRAGEREKFEALKRKKESAAEESKRLEDEKQAKENEEALIQARKALVHKAQPIRNFKPLEIKRSDKKLTMPFSPNIGLVKGPNCSR